MDMSGKRSISHWWLIIAIIVTTMWDIIPIPGFAQNLNEDEEVQKISGYDFLIATENDTLQEREIAIHKAILSGHFPRYLTKFKPVYFSDGKNQLVVRVSPDYLAIGSDSNFVRMPMGLDAALSIAQHFDCILPTSKMVDEIYAQSTLKIDAYYLPPGKHMVSNEYYKIHHQWIQGHFIDDLYQSSLIAGHKKDVVISKRLLSQENRLAIYGWQRLRDASPIQPLSTWHSRNYADYSHGVRLVSRFAWLNGKKQDLYELIKNPELAHLISDEGEFDIESLMKINSTKIAVNAH